ncbi:hypothetical protein X559_2388 [Paenilisteria newyorkensis]|nr:hypothetical protein X559_2388 [Listeria newyorkensis]
MESVLAFALVASLTMFSVDDALVCGIIIPLRPMVHMVIAANFVVNFMFLVSFSFFDLHVYSAK